MGSAVASSTLLGGVPFQSNAPSQGSVMLYTDTSCDKPLDNGPTALVYGHCLTMPIGGVKALSINSLPTCSDYGTPILLVSNQDGCKNSTQGTSADTGVIGNCSAYSTGVDLKSAQWACFSSGISAVVSSSAAETTAAASFSAAETTAAASSSAAETTMEPPTTTTGTDDGNGDEDEDHEGGGGSRCDCCCCCAVM